MGTPDVPTWSFHGGRGSGPAVARGMLGHHGGGRGVRPAAAEDVAQLEPVRAGAAVADGGELRLDDQSGQRP